MSLSQEARSDLYRWVNNVTFAFRNITQTNPDLTLTTDTSTIGWGGGALRGDQKTGELWILEEQYFFYAFPPFSVIAACLQKIEQDQATGVLLVPIWWTQPWFSCICE